MSRRCGMNDIAVTENDRLSCKRVAYRLSDFCSAPPSPHSLALTRCQNRRRCACANSAAAFASLVAPSAGARRGGSKPWTGRVCYTITTRSWAVHNITIQAQRRRRARSQPRLSCPRQKNHDQPRRFLTLKPEEPASNPRSQWCGQPRSHGHRPPVVISPSKGAHRLHASGP